MYIDIESFVTMIIEGIPQIKSTQLIFQSSPSLNL